MDANYRLFADECLIYKTYNTPEETKMTLQNDLYKLGFWSDKWMLNFNPSKCKVMHISNNKNVQKYPYFLKGEQLESVQFEKYLGIFIQSNLKWNKHVNYVYQYASWKLGM